jgi:hypothetical protein
MLIQVSLSGRQAWERWCCVIIMYFVDKYVYKFVCKYQVMFSVVCITLGEVRKLLQTRSEVNTGRT